MNKKLTALVCMLSLVLMLLPLPAAAADEEEIKQTISGAADLISLSAQVDAGNSFEGVSFVMTADIDLGGRSFTPIGTGNDAKKSFAGSFDGNGFTISGLNISGSYICAGLFGKLNGGTVENVVLDASCRISVSAANVGAIVGLSSGIVSGCVSNAAVTCSYDSGTANVGGIAGFSTVAGELVGCTNSGSISVSGANEKNTGGVAGCNKGRLERCINLGAVRGSSTGGINSVGGLIGFENDGTTQNSYNRADVSGSLGSENNVGGIAGRMSTNFGKLQNSYNTGKLTALGNGSSVGGVVGKKLVGTVYYCYYKKSGDLRGIGGSEDYPGYVTGMSEAQMKAAQGYAFGAWSNVMTFGKNLGGIGLADALNNGSKEVPKVWGIEPDENDGYPVISANYWTDAVGSRFLYADLSWINKSTGSASDPYVINTAAQLAGLAALVNTTAGGRISGAEPAYGSAYASNFDGKHFVLGASIDLEERLWTPIGDATHPFKGSFDGKNYDIHNMFVGTERVSSGLKYNGLFGYTLGTVKNISIEKDCSMFISGELFEGICAGGVAGFNGGSISGCESYCSVTASDCGELYLGGIVGNNRGLDATIERCYSSANLTADLSRITAVAPACVGGIVGISIRPDKQQSTESYKLSDETSQVLRNAVLSCKNESKLNITVRGKGAKALVGGVCGANVLIGSLLPDGFIGDSNVESDPSATLANCCDLGSIQLVLRAAGAMAAVGGVAGGNVFCGNEIYLRTIFTGNVGVSLGSRDGAAKTENSYSAGKVSATLTKGEQLLTGGVVGLISSTRAEVSNCFYSYKASVFGIGGAKADKSGETGTITMQSSELAQKLSDWAKNAEPKLEAWRADGAEYPHQCIRVLYNANGGENPPEDDHIYTEGDSAKLSFSVPPTRQDYVFLGWARSATASTAEFTANGTRTAKLSNDLTLFAVWQENKPKSKTTTSETKKNEDGTTSSISSTVTVAKNGNITTESTENITDANGQTVKTRTVSSFYDSATGATTQRVREKPVKGAATNSAGFIMDDADKVSALPEALTNELRAGSLESVTLTDKKNGTTTQLGWDTDKNGGRSSQSASLSCNNADGAVKLSGALIKELTSGSYEKLDIAAGGGLGLSLPAEALKGAESSAPTLALKRDGNSIQLSTGGTAIEAAASAEYEQQGENKVVAVDCVGADGEKTRVLAKFADGKVSFGVPVGAEKFEIVEIDFPFTDVSSGDWFDGVVRQMFGSGLMTGVSDTLFAPDGTASRAMLVTMLWRMEGEPESAQGGFADVSVDAWYASAVSWAAAKGIVSGVSADTFAPDAPVTREQLVTILYRWRGGAENIDELPGLSAFSDGGSASDYALDALRWAADKSYITGKSGGVLDPRGNASRSELAAILARVFGL